MSSRSAVNQAHRPVSAAPDSMTFDLHSPCDLLTSVKRRKGKQPIWQPYGLFCGAENDEVLSPGESLNQVLIRECWCGRQNQLSLYCSIWWYLRWIVIYQEWPCCLTVFETCLYSLSRGRQPLRVREHKVLGPYVDGLSRLAVASYKVKIFFLMNFSVCHAVTSGLTNGTHSDQCVSVQQTCEQSIFLAFPLTLIFNFEDL